MGQKAQVKDMGCGGETEEVVVLPDGEVIVYEDGDGGGGDFGDGGFGGGWQPSCEVFVNIADRDEMIFPAREGATIDDVRIWCEECTGFRIIGMTSPHLMREGLEWRGFDRLYELEGPWSNRIDLIALVEEWGHERYREHHRERWGREHGW